MFKVGDKVKWTDSRGLMRGIVVAINSLVNITEDHVRIEFKNVNGHTEYTYRYAHGVEYDMATHETESHV